jgi:hypothetical protein
MFKNCCEGCEFGKQWTASSSFHHKTRSLRYAKCNSQISGLMSNFAAVSVLAVVIITVMTATVLCDRHYRCSLLLLQQLPVKFLLLDCCYVHSET